jgi:cell wall-associated NlpC family hydrolase
VSVAELLQTYQNRTNPTAVKPISNTIKPIKPVKANIDPNASPVGAYHTPGSTVEAVLNNSKNNAQTSYSNYRKTVSTDLAQRVLKNSAGNVPVDQYGIVQKPTNDYDTPARNNIEAISHVGQTALQGAQDKAAWQKLNQLQNMNVAPTGATYDPKLIAPGAKTSNLGAQAVAIALTAFKNKTPYVWGGNSLVNGVDCSGLTQQAYAKLGIKLPRTTYEQAKFGQIINGVHNALPGDLIFYNTGSSDPNGIGKNSHVALYLGNGMVLEAYNSRVGIRESRVNASGTPATIVRPWS